MNKNERLFNIYRVFGYDYLFYTVIIFLFITQTKGISVGQYMHITAFYAMFSAIFQIPCNYIVELIGLKKSMMLGNIFLIIHCVMYILSPGFEVFIFAELFCAIGFGLKNVSEAPLLYSSLKRSGRKEFFAKIEGKTVSKFFYIEAISSCFVGYLFTLNNYLPITLTLIALITSLVISTKFVDMPIDREEGKFGIKEYFSGIKLILKSKRVISIFLYVFVIIGVIEVAKTLQKDMVVALQVDAVTYSIIFALLTFCMGLGSSMQYRIEKYTKRKTLTVIGFCLTLILTLLGLFMHMFNVSKFLIWSVVIMLVFHNLLQGTYRITVKKYLTNFTTSNIRSKILSVYYVFEGIGKFIMLYISGILIEKVGTNYTAIIVSLVGFLGVLYALEFMKPRLGLEPEEYSSDDIFGADIK